MNASPYFVVVCVVAWTVWLAVMTVMAFTKIQVAAIPIGLVIWCFGLFAGGTYYHRLELATADYSSRV
jgi:hypothetical protein